MDLTKCKEIEFMVPLNPKEKKQKIPIKPSFPIMFLLVNNRYTSCQTITNTYTQS